MLRYNDGMTYEDHVSSILTQWAAERPDLDVSPMGIVGRISRLSLVVEKELEPVFVQFGPEPLELRYAGDPAPCRSTLPTLAHRTLSLDDGDIGNDDQSHRPTGRKRAREART